MRYRLKQKLFSWGDDFYIRDANDKDVYFVDGKAFSIGDQLSFQDLQGNELAFIKQKVLAWGRTYEVYRNETIVAVVKKQLFSPFHHTFYVDVPGPDDLKAEGNFVDRGGGVLVGMAVRGPGRDGSDGHSGSQKVVIHPATWNSKKELLYRSECHAASFNTCWQTHPKRDHQMKRSFLRAALTMLAVVAAFVFISRPSSALVAAPSAVPAPAIDNALAAAPGQETAVFAGGCFWGIQAVFQHVKGVKSAVSGYTGGTTMSPSYEEVSSGATGHAESVRIVFDPSKVSYGQLLRVFFSVAHDPTQLNRQAPDAGTQYRSEIFYTSDAQKRIAAAYIDQLGKAKVYSKPIVTKLELAKTFNAAEGYHQNYATIHPNDMYIRINDAPKVTALKKDLSELYKADVSAWQ